MIAALNEMSPKMSGASHVEKLTHCHSLGHFFINITVSFSRLTPERWENWPRGNNRCVMIAQLK